MCISVLEGIKFQFRIRDQVNFQFCNTHEVFNRFLHFNIIWIVMPVCCNIASFIIIFLEPARTAAGAAGRPGMPWRRGA